MRHKELLEPVTLIVVVLAYLQAIVQFIQGYLSSPSVWQAMTVTGMSIVWIVIVAGSVLICSLLSDGNRVRLIALLGMIWLWLAVVVGLVGLVEQFIQAESMALFSLTAVGGLIELSFRAVLAVLITRIWLHQEPAPGEVVTEPVAVPVVEIPKPENPPVWEPGEAIGQQWLRAGDAATGAAGVQAESNRGRWQAGSDQPPANWAAIESRPLVAPENSEQ